MTGVMIYNGIILSWIYLAWWTDSVKIVIVRNRFFFLNFCFFFCDDAVHDAICGCGGTVAECEQRRWLTGSLWRALGPPAEMLLFVLRRAAPLTNGRMVWTTVGVRISKLMRMPHRYAAAWPTIRSAHRRYAIFRSLRSNFKRRYLIILCRHLLIFAVKYKFYST